MPLFLSAAVILGGFALAAEAPSDKAADKEPASYKVICKSVKMTGTRLDRNQICMTKKQWEVENDELNRSVRSGLGRSGKLPTK